MAEQALSLVPRENALVRAKAGLGLALSHFRLEARKHRLMFGGLAGTFLASLPIAALSARLYDIPAGSAVDGMLTLWTIVGLPMAAAIYGATAGAGLRASGTEEAEAPLPLPAVARLRGALAGAVSGFGVLFALVMGAWLVRVQGPSSATPGTLAAAVPFSAALELTVLTASFVVGFAARHAVLAGLAGLALGLVAFVPAGGAALVAWAFADRVELGVDGWAVLAALALGSPPAMLAAGRLTLPRLARAARVGLASWAAAGALLLAPLAPASLVFTSAMTRLNESRTEVGARWSQPPASEKAAFAAVPGRREGRFYATFEGGLVFQPEDGGEPEVVLAPGNPLSPVGLWREPYHPGFVHVGWGWDGRVWALKSIPRAGRIVREVYVAQGLGPLRLAAVCPDSCQTDGVWNQVVVSRAGTFPPLLFSNYLPLVVPYTGPEPDRDFLNSSYGATLRVGTPEIKP